MFTVIYMAMCAWMAIAFTVGGLCLAWKQRNPVFAFFALGVALPIALALIAGVIANYATAIKEVIWIG